MVLTYRSASATSTPSFFTLQLATALSNSFSNGTDGCLVLNFNVFSAFSTSIPRIRSASRRILRGEVGKFRKRATASIFLFYFLLRPGGFCKFLYSVKLL